MRSSAFSGGGEDEMRLCFGARSRDHARPEGIQPVTLLRPYLEQEMFSVYSQGQIVGDNTNENRV